MASLTRVRHVGSKNEADLKRAVHNAGPVIWIIIIIHSFRRYLTVLIIIIAVIKMSVIDILHQVAMSVHVNKKFKAYKSGIFNDQACPKNSANHALLTVGYILSSSSPKP